MNDRIQIDVHRLGEQGLLDERTRVASVTSGMLFQVRNLRADAGVALALEHPELAGQRLPASLAWSDPIAPTPIRFPRLEIRLPGGEKVERTYLQAALRVREVLGRLRASRPELAEQRPLLAFAGPVTSEPPLAPPAGVLRPELPALDVRVAELDLIELSSSERDLCVDLTHAHSDRIDVRCARRVLEGMVSDEGARASPFEERGWYLLGRVGRDPVGGGAVVLVEDSFIACDTVGSEFSLLWTHATKLRAALELDQRRASSGLVERIVGWAHVHDLNACKSSGLLDDEHGSDPATAASTLSNLFFSELDVELHLKDHGALAVGIVIDADAARRKQAVEKCVAAFRTVRGIVRRTAFGIAEE